VTCIRTIGGGVGLHKSPLGITPSGVGVGDGVGVGRTATGVGVGELGVDAAEPHWIRAPRATAHRSAATTGGMRMEVLPTILSFYFKFRDLTD